MRSDGAFHKFLREKAEVEKERELEWPRTIHTGGVMFDRGAGAVVVHLSGGRRLTSYSNGPVTFLQQHEREN